MNRLYTLIFLLLTVVAFNCQKEVHYVDLPGIDQPPHGELMVATVQGTVLNDAGQPAAGVSVRAGNKVSTTNAKGYFRIINAQLSKDAALVTAEKAGFFKAYRTFIATEAANHVVIKLVRKQLAGTIPAAGGEVMFGNGARLSLPSNAVVKKSGGAYADDIKVYAAYIDPTSADISQVVPGSFMADDKNGKRVSLASFGMMGVELESGAGEKLQIAPTAEATLQMPIPTSLIAAAPATISLWSVNEETGIWKEEGTATRTGENYTGKVKHFSFWNCDIGIPAVTVKLKIVNKESSPLIHARLRLSVPNGNISAAYGYTDSMGVVSGLVPSNQALLLEILDECNTAIYSQNIGPFTTSADLGSIMISNSSPAIFTVKGKLVNCTNAPVTRGSVEIVFGYMTIRAEPSADGTFSASFLRCGMQGDNTISVTGFDDQANQMGNSTTFTLSTPEINTGNISACGVSTEEFISYAVDGVEYSITESQGTNRIWSSVMPNRDSTRYNTMISGNSDIDNITFEFDSPEKVAGSYPLKHLDVNEHTAIVPSNTVNVTLTRFGAVPSTIFEGSFSGQFKDSLNHANVHTISASFRVRRQ